MSIETIRNIKLAAQMPKPKKIYTIPKKSAKRIEREKAQLNNEENLDKWFDDRRKEMTGHCFICGGKTEKDNDETYRRSIHHLFDKRGNMFPSVKLHPDNYLEVCFFGNSCHTNIHNGTITWQLLKDSKEWEVIVDKFKKIYPCMNPNEHKNIPTVLLEYLNP